MTSVNRVGDRTSGHTEETIRIGLTEAEAETLGMILRRVGGPNFFSRRHHCDTLRDGLSMVGVMSTTDDADPSVGQTTFSTEHGDYVYPLNL
jgi:hypothetical protein